MDEDMEIEVKGFTFHSSGIIERVIVAAGKSNKIGRVYVPKEWIGERVKIIKIKKDGK